MFSLFYIFPAIIFAVLINSLPLKKYIKFFLSFFCSLSISVFLFSVFLRKTIPEFIYLLSNLYNIGVFEILLFVLGLLIVAILTFLLYKLSYSLTLIKFIKKTGFYKVLFYNTLFFFVLIGINSRGDKSELIYHKDGNFKVEKSVKVSLPYQIEEGNLTLVYSTSNEIEGSITLLNSNFKEVKTYNLLSAEDQKTITIPLFEIKDVELLIENKSNEGQVYIHNYNLVGLGQKRVDFIQNKSFHTEVYEKDVNRFIAHAGGQIEGDKYTNSLEALNLNYKKGFRLFELDIITTSDGKFIASHDWEGWKAQVNYTGEIPVSDAEFKKHKILGKYSPMNMDAINSWFKKHTDAILVTDKINKPQEFSKQFIDKNRLMMELFSEEAVKEGLTCGIKSVMPSSSHGLLDVKRFDNKILEQLIKLGIKDIAVSRKYIKNNKTFLLRLKDAGIRAYVFHVNTTDKEDEQYVVDYELDYVYGMYASNWSFLKSEK